MRFLFASVWKCRIGIDLLFVDPNAETMYPFFHNPQIPPRRTFIKRCLMTIFDGAIIKKIKLTYKYVYVLWEFPTPSFPRGACTLDHELISSTPTFHKTPRPFEKCLYSFVYDYIISKKKSIKLNVHKNNIFIYSMLW